MGDLHLEPAQMHLFEEARAQLAAAVTAGGTAAPRVVQLGARGTAGCVAAVKPAMPPLFCRCCWGTTCRTRRAPKPLYTAHLAPIHPPFTPPSRRPRPSTHPAPARQATRASTRSAVPARLTPHTPTLQAAAPPLAPPPPLPGDLGGYKFRPGSRACFEQGRSFLAAFGLPATLVTGNHE